MRSLVLAGLLAFGGSVAPVAAEDATATEWVSKLTDIYQKQQGFIATYHCEGKTKSLDATLAYDDGSNRSAIILKGKKDGDTFEMRHWTTDDGSVIIEQGPQQQRVSGLRDELESLSRLMNKLGYLEEPSSPHFKAPPRFALTKDSIICGLFLNNNRRTPPNWEEFTKDATLKSVAEDQVTFQSPKWGDLTISRKTGLLIRQSLKREDDEPLTLELTNIQLNPGEEAVAKLCSGREEKKAERVPTGTLTSSLRLLHFQSVISKIESGKGDLEKLETLLEDQSDTIRAFADSCLVEGPGTLAASDIWKVFLGKSKDELRKQWALKKNGKEEDEAGFERYLAEPATRKEFRDDTVKILMAKEDYTKRAMWEIFHIREALKTTDETGEHAKSLIEKALARGYFEALLDRKMVNFWSAREGLD